MIYNGPIVDDVVSSPAKAACCVCFRVLKKMGWDLALAISLYDDPQWLIFFKGLEPPSSKMLFDTSEWANSKALTMDSQQHLLLAAVRVESLH